MLTTHLHYFVMKRSLLFGTETTAHWKHTVKVGEPGSPVAGMVLVSISKRLVVSDHDFTKFSLTPSVSFLIKACQVHSILVKCLLV